MKHIHAELLRKFADNSDLKVQGRAPGNSFWNEPQPAASTIFFTDYEYRDADDWRNKFRDALERGEVVEYFFMGAEWRARDRPTFTGKPEDYRIKPKADPYQVFRDALARGEVVEHFNGHEWGGPPEGMKWVYGNRPETYRIKTIFNLDVVEECLNTLYAGEGGGINRDILRRALDALQKHRGS